MNKGQNIRRGFLADKLARHRPEPPESVWQAVSSQLGGGLSRRKLFIILTTAAGFAIAATVGVVFLNRDFRQEYAAQQIEESGEVAEQQEIERMVAPNDLSDMASPMSEPAGARGSDGFRKLSADRYTAGDSGKRTEGGRRMEEQVRISVQEILKESISQIDNSTFTETGFGTIAVNQGGHVGSLAERVGEPGESNDNQGRQLFPVADLSDSLVKPPQKDLYDDQMHDDQRISGRWQLGASFSPLYNYRDVSSQTDHQRMLANNSETAKLTYAGGVQVSYNASKRVTIESGLFYTRMGVNIGDYSSFKNGWFNERMEYSDDGTYENFVSISNSMGTIRSDHNDLFLSNSGNIESTTDYHLLYPVQMMVDNAVVENFSQSLEYLEIPLNMKFLLVDRSLKVQLIGGISTNVMINNSVSANSMNGSVEIGDLQNLRSLSYSGNAGIGFLYDLYKNISLSLEPRFRYYLHSVNTGQLPSTRPYTFGLYTGINYKF